MPDSQGDRPNFQQTKFFESAVGSHDKVESIESKRDQVYELERRGGLSPLTVYLTNLYTVGSADVLDIKSRCSEVDCIVTISNWNGYSDDAKELASSRRIGLFTFSEFMGALNWTQFWRYKPKRDN